MADLVNGFTCFSARVAAIMATGTGRFGNPHHHETADGVSQVATSDLLRRPGYRAQFGAFVRAAPGAARWTGSGPGRGSHRSP